MFQYDEHEQHFERDRGHSEEVNRNHLTEVIAQERLPGRAGRPRQSPEDSGDSAFGNLDAEHFQRAMNPGCAPQGVGGNHPFDETSISTAVAGRPRSRWFTVRLPTMCLEGGESVHDTLAAAANSIGVRYPSER
jgi:hypothetical protein